MKSWLPRGKKVKLNENSDKSNFTYIAAISQNGLEGFMFTNHS